MNARTYINNISSLLATLLVAGILPFSSLCAQETFTEHLTTPAEGQGQVTIRQDAEIESLVNGTARPVNNSPAPRAPRRQWDGAQRTAQADSLGLRDSTERVNPVMTGRRARANGFRIQVFAGGTDRRSQAEAFRMSGVVHNYFDDLQVYTHFVSPRWICRVGDFTTYEEAQEVLERMRHTGMFPEATIVKTKIVVYY